MWRSAGESPRTPARLRLVVAKRRADKPLPGSIGEHLTNRPGWTKKHTLRKFSRALLKLLCQSFHRPFASQSLTLLTFAQADVVHIHGIGRSLRDWLACHRKNEAVEHMRRNLEAG